MMMIDVGAAVDAANSLRRMPQETLREMKAGTPIHWRELSPVLQCIVDSVAFLAFFVLRTPRILHWVLLPDAARIMYMRPGPLSTGRIGSLMMLSLSPPSLLKSLSRRLP